MNKIASHILSAYSIICTHTVDELLNVGNYSQNGSPIPSFDEELLINLCSEVQKIFEKENNVLEIEGDFVIVGDIHGSLHDLLRILRYTKDSNLKVLFLGDYVDRGNFSLECITILFALKLINPDSVYLIRGNHEFDSICCQYGFKDEILNYSNPKKPDNSLEYAEMLLCDDESQTNIDEYFASHKNKCCYKYTESLYNAFVNTFSYLPICAIVNKTTFCVHGGLCPKLELIDQINTLINRPIRTFEECPLLSELVWSDPSSFTNGLFDSNPRGNGYLFNREAVYNFLKKNSLKRIIRAHECVYKGCLQNFDDKCITVFSVSSYGKFLGNSSAVLKLFQSDDRIESTVFMPLRHLPKYDAIYYKVQAFDQKNVKINNCFSLAHPKLISNVTVRNTGSKNKNKNKSIPFHGSNIGAVPLIKPKFVTNSRKSYPYKNRNTILHQVPSNNLNENTYLIDENNRKYNVFNSAP